MLLIIQFANAQNPDFLVVPAGFNSAYNDFSPFFSGENIYFISDRPDQIGVYYSSLDSVERLTNIYSVKVEEDTLFQQPSLLDKKINRLYNSGPCWINADQSHIYFSSNEAVPFVVYTSKEKSKLKLFLAERTKNSWNKRIQLHFQHEDANYTHPFLTASEDTLYFASDMSGGQGGYDLYYVIKNGDSWSLPVNLGSDINSPQNDVFPVIFDRKLIFSSSREGGFGKLDLYECGLTGGIPVNLQMPFNSESDDFGAAFISDGSGYFSSSRNGNDDVFYFRQLFPVFKECQPYEKDKFCFTFFEETADLDDTLDLEYQWNFGDGTVAAGKEARHCFKGYGEYLVELNIVDKSTNALFFNEASYPFSIDPSERLHLEGPDTVPPSTLITFYAGNSSVPGYTIEEFYWELDGPETRQTGGDTYEVSFDSESTHNLKMGVTVISDETGRKNSFCVTKNITVKIGTVYDHLPEAAVIADSPEDPTPEDTVTYTLFLAVSDTLIPGLTLYDSDSIKVEQTGENEFIYTFGEAKEKHELLDEFREAQEMGFTGSRVTEVANGKLTEEILLVKTEKKDVKALLRNQLSKDQILASQEIFYGTDIAVLNADQRNKLKLLTQRNPLRQDQRILIVSFTDRKGNDAYNLDLSKRRSEAVKKELLQNGYPAEEIEIEYYGRRVPEDMEPLTDAKRRKSIIIIYEIN